MINIINIVWWVSVSVGDKLRLVDHDGDALLHVVAVFNDNDRHFVVTKEWWPRKQRWNYQVYSDVEATVGLIYRDGYERPR